MRIIFVRHRHPNYEKDCLTDLGVLHAKAVAQRLKNDNEPIEKIFSSTCGRALETASFIDSKFGVGVVGLDFMREIKWGSVDGNPIFDDGHPWNTSNYIVENGASLLDFDWQKSDLYKNNKLVSCVEKIGIDFDNWLKDFGYVREGDYYRVGDVKNHTISLVSHGGASSAVFAHLFNLPFPFLCSAICPDYTAITIVHFSERKGNLIAPKFELVNDARHIRNEEFRIKNEELNKKIEFKM